MRFDFELQICIFRSQNHLLMQSEYAKSDRNFFDLRIRWPKSSDFGPKFDDLGHQIFESKNGMVSKFKTLSTAASRTI